MTVRRGAVQGPVSDSAVQGPVSDSAVWCDAGSRQ